ncbi:MAG: methyltransferase domain-containing protein [Terriglobales bacterium]
MATHSLIKLFRGASDETRTGTRGSQNKQRVTRKSSGMTELARVLRSEDTLCVLDIGYTSATNIRYLTELGHHPYSEDLLDASTDPSLIIRDENNQPAVDAKRFLSENLTYPAAQFDVVMCWNLADYLDEALVKPTVARLWSVMKPGGALLAFFHTQEAGLDAPCYRYHIVAPDTLEMQHIEAHKDLRKAPPGATQNSSPTGFRLQRVFNNRHIENLFRDFASIKFFLTRDNVREVLVIR